MANKKPLVLDANGKSEQLQSGDVIATTDVQNLSGTNSGNETAGSIGTLIAGSATNNPPADGDYIGISDVSASNILTKNTWAQVKSNLSSYFQTIFLDKATYDSDGGGIVDLSEDSQKLNGQDASYYQAVNAKDVSDGYVGLTLLKINFKNVANTFTSFFTNTNTASRTYTFQNRNGTIIDDTNLVTGSTDNAILRADGTGGATTQSSGISIDDSANIVLPTIVATEQKGIIYKGSTRFMHTYVPATGGFGGNIFIGLNAGNFTMTATGASDSGSNIGIGNSALTAVNGSTGGGYQNVGIGVKALTALTTGTNNFGCGTNSFTKVTTSADNVGVGSESGRFVTGGANTFFGTQSGKSTDGTGSFSNCCGFGFQTLVNAKTGSTANICIGYRAGDVITSGANNIIIGKDSDPSSATASSQLNIGDTVYGANLYGTGQIGIGVTSANITARLHLPAGSTSASSAPLKINSGSLMTNAEAGAVEFLTDALYFTQTTNTVRKEICLREGSRVSSQFDKTTTVLANVTGLTATVGAGKTYTFKAVLFVDADATGGYKVAVSGTATATTLLAQCNAINNGTNAFTINSRLTTMGSSVSTSGGTSVFIEIKGLIVVNATGTLTIQFAQNSGNGTSSILVGSHFIVENIL